jgi:hypothetical protein
MPFLKWIPSWLDIEAQADRIFSRHRIGQRPTGLNPLSHPTYLNAPRMNLIYRRIRCVRTACHLAEREAADSLLKRFADLDIRSILHELISVVADMAMIIIGSALTGAAIGGGAGLLAGGIGAFPGAAAGALVGVEAGTWILGILGLASIAEFLEGGWKPIVTGYIRGVSTAWNGPQERTGNPLGSFSSDGMAAQQGSWDIARSHEAVVILLLSGMVAYLTRGRGNASVLAGEMSRSKRGADLGQWMVKHEEAMKRHPDLKPPEPRRGALGPEEPSPANRPGGKDKEPPNLKPNSMPPHKVECFKSHRLPTSKIVEFRRQLKGQQEGLNRLTVAEYLENIANPIKRSPAVARAARKDLQNKLQERFQKELLKSLSPRDARAEALKQAKELMSTLAGLHNPDLGAGGKDIIGDFGDRQVNSSIGPQWRPKIEELKEAAQRVPESLRQETYLNVKLYRCGDPSNG